MSKTDAVDVVPTGEAWAMICGAETPVERRKIARWAVEGKEVMGFDLPVPPFFFDLPWADDGDAVVDDILAGIAAADDLEKATEATELRKLADILDQPVEIFGVQARKGDIADSRWGAYITLTVSVNGEPAEVVHTGSGQVTVTVWRLYVEGKLPAKGVFTKVAEGKRGRNAPIGLRLESDF